VSLPAFKMHRPGTTDEVVSLLEELRGQCTLMGGGTDLLPSYAQHLNARPHVISLAGVHSMKRLAPFSIGAGVTLSELVANGAILPQVIPETARGIAGPAVRDSATVGGNLLLTGRCRFLNQSPLFRAAGGSCMKAGASACLAVAQEDSCYAICSGDLVPVMLALGASFQVAGPGGTRLIPAERFYLPDGIQANALTETEFLTEVSLPQDTLDVSCAYLKLGGRSAIDFPEAGVAVAVKRERGAGRVDWCRIAIGALGPGPAVITLLGNELRGIAPDEICGRAWKSLSKGVMAVRNGTFRPGYRKQMAKEYLGTLLTKLLASDGGAL
jgi:4-hydroxybenzoyl-CoA reductase subunit beta